MAGGVAGEYVRGLVRYDKLPTRQQHQDTGSKGEPGAPGGTRSFTNPNVRSKIPSFQGGKMGDQPERFNLTVTNYGRKAIITVKRGKIGPIKTTKNSQQITISFPENSTRKPK